ncbi:hypothetical protein BDQ17DRAFT_604579 [Cyathus striatus]|nr:hypothetical protein BDQ17DRAFT_604579 [Cyathus striatus]
MQRDIPFPNQDPSSPVSQQGLVFPTPSVQNHIHELAKTLPPPRKQNTACDACRTRKVKCHKLPGQDKCQHCLSKNYPCTHYVQQATSEKKRSSAVSRRPRNLSNANHKYVADTAATFAPSSSFRASFPATQKFTSPISEHTTLSSLLVLNGQHHVPLNVRYGFCPQINLSTPTRQVLSYVFAPPDISADTPPFSPGRQKSAYDLWGEYASKLEDDKFRAEFALDLVEVFFQIVHTRLPLLNPAQFRNRLQLQPSAIPSSDKPLHPALVATVLAWGAKFSEHPLLTADRLRPGGQSILAKTMIDRARDLAEALKVHRIPSSDHVVIGLLIEPLQSQNPDDPNGYHGFWLTSATRHLLDLGINHKSVMANIQDQEARGTMIFAWWMTCICDAYASAYYRRKPILDDDDYDIDFYTVDHVTEAGDGQPSPREQLEAISRRPRFFNFDVLTLGVLSRCTCSCQNRASDVRQLWRPATDADGVPFEVLCSITHALTEWRDEFLNVVGVPSNFEGEWDFVSAVSSCASDATYHVMWIILFSALDEYGIKELNIHHGINSPEPEHIVQVKKRVVDEALHGALRIAGLAGVLTSNGYLRLDPAVMHVSCIQAGTLLARLGRPEVSNCIAGLEQYSQSYEEAGDQAQDMRRLFDAVRSGHRELNHMASVAPRIPQMSHSQSPPPNGNHHHSHHHAMSVDDNYMNTNNSPTTS